MPGELRFVCRHVLENLARCVIIADLKHSVNQKKWKTVRQNPHDVMNGFRVSHWGYLICLLRAVLESSMSSEISTNRVEVYARKRRAQDEKILTPSTKARFNLSAEEQQDASRDPLSACASWANSSQGRLRVRIRGVPWPGRNPTSPFRLCASS